MKAYEMKMKFTATVGVKFVNDILRELGDPGRYQIKDALTITIEQVLPFIPTEEYLRKVEQTITEHYQINDFDILECHFAGYSYLREVDISESKPKESEAEST